MCSWVLTAPAGLATNKLTRADGSEVLSFDGAESDLKRFFQEAYQFMNDRYAMGGDRNVISAYVHMDETTPHLHYAFVPVARIKKTTPKGKKVDEERVSAKDLINRADLKTFHQDLENHMKIAFGREINILNQATKGGNLTTQELKHRTAIAEAKAELKEATRPIEGKIAHQKRINAMIDNTKESKSIITGKVKTIITFDGAIEEAMTVLDAAKDRDSMRIRRNKVVLERQVASADRDKAISERKAMKRELGVVKKDIIIREQSIEARERTALQTQKQAVEKLAQADALYQQQLQLNQLHQQAIADCDNYKNQSDAERQKITALASENAVLQTRLNDSHEAIKNIVKAVGMLKHDKNSGYSANLTDKQGRLIDAIGNYGAKVARMAGRADLADDIDRHVVIEKDIEVEVRALEPRRSRGYDHDR